MNYKRPHRLSARRSCRDRWDMALGVALIAAAVLISVAWIGLAYYHDCQHHRSNTRILTVCNVMGW
jgi:hypothetical protein